MSRRPYHVEYFKVGFGGSVRIYGRRWTAWPWSRWVKVWCYTDRPIGRIECARPTADPVYVMRCPCGLCGGQGRIKAS